MEKPSVTGTNRSSLLPQIIEEVDHSPNIQFGATTYAVNESDQEVIISVKRTGPLDITARFRCLHSLVIHSHMLCYDTMQHFISQFIYI
jgi:hypothetical protein